MISQGMKPEPLSIEFYQLCTKNRSKNQVPIIANNKIPLNIVARVKSKSTDVTRIERMRTLPPRRVTRDSNPDRVPMGPVNLGVFTCFRWTTFTVNQFRARYCYDTGFHRCYAERSGCRSNRVKTPKIFLPFHYRPRDRGRGGIMFRRSRLEIIRIDICSREPRKWRHRNARSGPEPKRSVRDAALNTFRRVWAILQGVPCNWIVSEAARL